MRSARFAKATALCAVGVVALAGCAGGDTSGSGKEGTVNVVTGVYPLQWLATQVGGDHVDVTELTKPGDEPHDLELGPRQIGEISQADLAFHVEGLQPAVDDAVHQEASDHALDVADMVTLRSASEDDGHEHGEDGGHEHGEKDPHMWLDPELMSSVAKGLGDRLAKVDPDHAEDYRDGAAGVRAELDSIDTEYTDGLENCKSHDIVVNHSAFGYLAARYNLRQIGVSGLDPDSEPSPARMAQISKLVKKDDITTVFTETLADKSVAETVSKETGARTETLDPLEGITKESPGDDYPSVMRGNLDALRTALRCE